MKTRCFRQTEESGERRAPSLRAVFGPLVAAATLSCRIALAQSEPTPNPEAATPTPTASSAEAPRQPSGASDAGANDVAAQRFVGTCAGCHTVGGGALRGPDLAGTSEWPETQLTAAVQSMQRKVGSLSQSQITSLVQLLKDKAIKERLSKARASLADDSEVKSDQPNSLHGGALFFGKVALENGGMACSSCHRFLGEGGDLGPDLSQYAAPLEIEGLAGSISRAGFPVMRAAYQAHPITRNEARHIAAFMKQTKSNRDPMAASTITTRGLGSGLAAFVSVLLYIATRPRGIRSRLVQGATKR